MTRVWVLSATFGQRKQLERLLAPFVAPINWRIQRHTGSTQQSIFEIAVDAAWLASELAKHGVVFEIEGDGELFLHHPGLGIHRQQLDEAGEPIIRFGQLETLLEQAAGSLSEFLRLKRLAQGQPWLDLLEPYRLGLQRVDQLPKAI